jgi:hypothetical protein
MSLIALVAVDTTCVRLKVTVDSIIVAFVAEISLFKLACRWVLVTSTSFVSYSKRPERIE